MDRRPARSRRVTSLAARLLPPLCAAVLLVLSPAVVPTGARAGEWRVSPIRLDLGREAKTGVVTVTNDSEEKLRLEVTAREWTQDADGKDVYADSADLVYYPKMMVLGAKEQRIVRAGIRVPAAAREKAYRLFIEEIPGPPASRGTAVAVAVRFGVPVFVRPPRDEPKPEIGPVALDNGTVSVRVRNAGNAHCVVRGVTVTGRNSRGEPVFSREINGWYLLAGASRGYAAGIPADVCPDVASVDVEVRTDKSTLAGRVDADRSKCPP